MKVDLTPSHEALLVALQQGIPIEPRPFARLGREFGLSEEKVLDRIRAWFESGLARRFGAVFDARGLGYRSTLCAADIPGLELDAAAARLVPHPGITHCYERDGRPNLWFTLTAPADALQDDVARVAKAIAPHDVVNLPAVRKFKIEAVFGHGHARGSGDRIRSCTRAPEAGEAVVFGEKERRLVRCIQSNMDLVAEPFSQVARQTGYDPQELLALLTRWRDRGIIRRIALVVRHRELGFTANCMCVWNVAAEGVGAAGMVLARSPHVSHCYERSRVPAFPYNLYAMFHGRCREETLGRIAAMEKEAGLHGGVRLWSVREFKKASPVFFDETRGGTPEYASRPGLLLVAAGSSCPEARGVFDRIGQLAGARFPGVSIRWAYTSAGVRRKLALSGVHVDTPEQALSVMQSEAISPVAVIALHLSAGREFNELLETVDAFRRAEGALGKVRLGPPLFADAGNWRKALDVLLESLADRRSGEDAVVLVAHGSPDPRGAASFEAAAGVCRLADPRLFLGMILGHPSRDEVVETCKRIGARRVWLLPCLVAAGYTARNDVAGPDAGSWKTCFEQAGMECFPILKGLGEYDGIVELWMEQAGNLLAALGWGE